MPISENLMSDQPIRKHILQHECHLHLYGCLSKESLWDLAPERAQKYPERMKWFQDEYLRLTQQTIDASTWWTSSSGFEQMTRHFICSGPVTFEEFQAKFNLLIALFPISAEDLTLPRQVFQTDSVNGGYKEYRMFLPPWLTTDQKSSYVFNLISLAKEFETSSYHPRIAIGVARDLESSMSGYDFIAHFRRSNPGLAPFITGIDFSGLEYGFPPEAQKGLFNKIRSDRSSTKTNLNILYHVGEMWLKSSLHTAARWCVEAAELGADRLGHALALGVDCKSYFGDIYQESHESVQSHFRWIQDHKTSLQNFGFAPNDYQWLVNEANRHISGNVIHWHYSQDLIENTTRFQNALLQMIRQFPVIIESCPSSNMRIGHIRTPASHPLKRFMDHELNVVIATDDPGLFDIDLEDEENFARNIQGLSKDQLIKSNELTKSIFTARV